MDQEAFLRCVIRGMCDEEGAEEGKRGSYRKLER